MDADFPCYERKEDLLAAAAAEGEDLSDFQLAEWRRRGLVPRPRPGPGLGRGKGREYCYPSGTAKLVRRIVRWLRWDRRLDVVGWCLWTDSAIGPLTYRIPEAVAADSVDSIIGRYVDIGLWEKEAHPDSPDLARTEFFQRLAKYFEQRPLSKVSPSDIAFEISTIARDVEAGPGEEEWGWPAEIQAHYRIARDSRGLQEFADILFNVLDPLIPGWTTRYGKPWPLDDPSMRGAKTRKARVTEFTLLAFNALLVAQRELFDPKFLGRWMRDPDRRFEVLEAQRDLLAMSRALFPERFGKEPPSPLLLWLLVLVHRSRVTFHGARDAYGWFGLERGDQSHPEPLPELDPLRRAVDAMPVKKSYLRGRPDEDHSDR